jgi:hypothetical protein
VLHLQIHQFGRGHHVGVRICRDPKRSGGHEAYDEHAKGQRQHVIGVVRSGGDVQEADEVNADLRDIVRATGNLELVQAQLGLVQFTTTSNTCASPTATCGFLLFRV